jgi:hypothetical protein
MYIIPMLLSALEYRRNLKLFSTSAESETINIPVIIQPITHKYIGS